MKKNLSEEGKCVNMWCNRKDCPRWFHKGDSQLVMADYLGSASCVYSRDRRKDAVA